jgi:anti-sigma regulatory factor (Ser/Thr protein kinase)
MHVIRRTFSARDTSPALGRRLLDEFEASVPSHRLDDARLLLSEVMTDAIRRPGRGEDEQIAVRITGTSGELLVEFSDPAPGSSTSLVNGSRNPASGWGLLLLDRLSDSWGVRTEPETGWLVWFRMTLGDAGPSNPG